ncbi:MAG: isoprenyl transferase [Pseudomonadota bacterium]
MGRLNGQVRESAEAAMDGSSHIDVLNRRSPAVTVGAGTKPLHVAIIMDGNGRWANARSLPRLAGHRAGVETVREIVKASPDLGVSHLTLYAFSTENWRRPMTEVIGLMELFRQYLRREAAQLAKDGVKVVFLGDPEPLDRDIRAMMTEIEEATAHNTRLTVAMAVNYGARREIVSAVQSLVSAAAEGEIEADEIDENVVTRALYTGDLPDPDLVIRTSGEKRLSNFLLWQCAYAEFVFVPEMWPEFRRDRFAAALQEFRNRSRRYGAL